MLFPGLLFSTIFILNLFVWAQASSTALPFGTLCGLLFLWLFIQLPLVYVGSWYGFDHSQPYEHPTQTSSIPRQVPEQAWYTKSIHSVLLAGLVPFAVIFIELLFVFRSLWQDKSGYYYVFGFLTVVSIVNIVTVVEVTIVATYIQLCAEKLPLVVAVRLHWRRQRLLGLPLLRLVLLHQAQYPRFRVRHAVFQLQPAGVFGVRIVDGHSRVLNSICICEAYIWVSVNHPSRQSLPAALANFADSVFAGQSRLISKFCFGGFFFSLVAHLAVIAW